MNFQDKVIVVTGAGGGVGRRLVLQLLLTRRRGNVGNERGQDWRDGSVPKWGTLQSCPHPSVAGYNATNMLAATPL